jgi:hypothetical protein
VSKNVLWGAGALVAGAALAGIVALFTFGSHGGSAVTPTQLQPTVATVLRPPHGALVLGQEAGTRAVALAAKGRTLTATVLRPSGGPETGLRVYFLLGESRIPAQVCGAGCYRATAAVAPRRVVVSLPASSAAFDIPASTKPGSQIVSRAARAFRNLRSLVYLESLRSGPTGGIVTTWSMSAPDRVSYNIHRGAAAVVIGRRRWDKAKPGARWVASQSPTLHVPAPTWGGDVTNARVIGSTTLHGLPVWIVSFATPSVPAWFTAWIDKRTDRTLQLRMTAAGHFMFHRYTAFNEPLKIRPPR